MPCNEHIQASFWQSYSSSSCMAELTYNAGLFPKINVIIVLKEKINSNPE